MFLKKKKVEFGLIKKVIGFLSGSNRGAILKKKH